MKMKLNDTISENICLPSYAYVKYDTLCESYFHFVICPSFLLSLAV